MKIPLQISYRNTEPSEAIAHAIAERGERLERLCDRITACKVMVEAPHRHRTKGVIYRVRVDLTVPGEELVVGRDRPHGGEHEDLYVSIRDAFNAAERQLRQWVLRRRGHVKNHNNGRGTGRKALVAEALAIPMPVEEEAQIAS